MAKFWTIYKATSPSGKVYVGQTCKTVELRFSKHSYDAGRGSNCPFHRAIRKYGLDTFKIERVGVVHSKNDADALEKDLIKSLQLTDPAVGYNVADGGQGGGAHRKPHSEETKAKISFAKKGKKLWPNGRTFSEEFKQKQVTAAIYRRKPVKCITTGQEFSSLAEAASFFAFKKGHISRVCLGKRPAHKGLKFTYLANESQ